MDLSTVPVQAGRYRPVGFYYEIVIEEHGNSGGFMSTFYYYDGESSSSWARYRVCAGTPMP